MIQILCVDLSSVDEELYQRLYQQASPERKARADRYRRKEDAIRCVAAEALLCYALGTNNFHLEKTPSGKPFLPERKDFYFNLSHSGNWVVIAYGSSEVGLDVENLRSDTKIEAMARRFFAPEEQRYIFAEEDGRQQRFFEIWTGKESYVKYLGTGLQKDLTSFNVLSLEPGIRIHRRVLPDGSLLSLCTRLDDYMFRLLEPQCLVDPNTPKI